MRQRKREREVKRQNGQYMTPAVLAKQMVSALDFNDCRRILEPSCGEGVFLAAIMDRLTSEPGSSEKPIELIGVEIDPLLADRARAAIQSTDAVRASVCQADFFRHYIAKGMPQEAAGNAAYLRPGSFDLIVGNPPFGGTFDPAIEDELDNVLGKRLGKKIKKETYAFFIVACLDLLREEGRLVFVCSDTLLTIPTMTGLRRLLMESGEVELSDISQFSDEVSYPMLILSFKKGGRRGLVSRNSETIDQNAILTTPNLSWGGNAELARLFSGPSLGDYFVASSGMTTGKNEFFVRRVDVNQQILEPYTFEFYNAPVTVDYETQRARMGRVPANRRSMLEQAEASGQTERRLKVVRRDEPLIVQLPDERYRPYNKANNRLVFSEPTHYIFWENDGEAVLTYKRTGNWYLRGVGGQPYFGREGITWQLVASRFIMRYIPSGYILDSGAPCAFLRDGVDRDELFFVMGWLLSPLANRVLKTVINHTRNIQSKDFERMPYPWWVADCTRSKAIRMVKSMIEEASKGRLWAWHNPELHALGGLFEMAGNGKPAPDSFQTRETDRTPWTLL